MDSEDIKIGCGIIGVIIGFIVGVTILYFIIVIPSCNDLQRRTGNETQFSFWNSCLVKVNGQFIPSEQWVNNSGK